MSRRALHFVFKIGNRTRTAHFYRDVLGMKFLRHEEFEEGCKATCNGPYDGRWSKSMVGYGPEDDHFVVELTYNYGIGSYKLGNDFKGLTIHRKGVIAAAKANGFEVTDESDGKGTIVSPDGYVFHVVDEVSSGDPVKMVTLGSSNLQKSIDFWHGMLGMNIVEKQDSRVRLCYEETQCALEIVDLGTSVDHAKAFGRMAFSCPRSQLPEIESSLKAAGHVILTPLVSLDTPGKAAVEVVIVADPDGHEICFVGDEAFRELAQVDSKADQLLDEAIDKDKSDEWYKKKGKEKAAA